MSSRLGQAPSSVHSTDYFALIGLQVSLTSGGRYTGQLRGMFRLNFLQRLRTQPDLESQATMV